MKPWNMRQFIRNALRKILAISAPQKTIMLNLGKSVTLDPNLQINAGYVTIGDYSYTGPGRISSLPETRITIGKFTSIAAGIQIVGALHKSHIVNYSFPRLLPKEEGKLFERGVSRGDITIGNDVWIGTNVIILSGVTIGDGAIIGAGAVVTKDIPAYAIAVGVPALVKKFRFSKEEIELLLEAKWWNWDIEKINRNIPLFYDKSLSVKDFIESAMKDGS